MGWSIWHDTRATKDILKEEIERNPEHRVVKSSGKYWAVRNVETGEVFAYVILTTRRKNGEFGYKAMHESVGPFHFDCPQNILRCLTPTQSKYAQEWRDACWNRHAAKAAIRSDLREATHA